MSSPENLNVKEQGVENNQEKDTAISSLKKGSVEIGSDVKQMGVPEGVSFGADYENGQYATNNGWANLKVDGLMRAVYVTPEVSKQLEQSGFKKIDAGVVDNNPDRFHAGMNSSALTSMVKQVGDAKQQEKNKDGQFLTDEAYITKYGVEKNQ